MIGRIVIDDIRPRTPTGRYPAKVAVGERVVLRATIFKDGHDLLAARARLVPDPGPSGTPPAKPERAPGRWPLPGADLEVPMVALGNDEWAATITPPSVGPFAVVIEAWTDRHASWAARVRAKAEAAQDLSVEIDEGVLLIEERGADHPALAAALAALKDDGLASAQRLAPALSPATATAMAGPSAAHDRTVSDPVRLWVDRPRAAVGAWYEVFPRSLGGLRPTAEAVPAIAAMGFDVLYLPPIHPIGTSHRKGRNNTLEADAGDPGSPWAIGSARGGHSAIDPTLGTFEDFDYLVSTLQVHGMEIALDYALQCSPDHPWVSDHPAWFHHRPDGSVAYAENPPKKYQDIYPLNFWPDEESEREALWAACRDILGFWISRGVRIFRVDNPHTKPMAFWEWLIPDVQRRHPEVIFLAEAFTRPKVMAKLAEVGFTQSYTYFTWRTAQHGPEGLRAYLEELAHGNKADFMRPNFWPNTPDILSGPLRDGPPPAFALRLVLAATMSPSYGVYSGYELYENQPASADNEEYLNSEKYEVKHRDFEVPGTLRPLMTRLNGIRRSHPALASLRSIRFHDSDNPEIIAYSKTSDDGTDVVLVVVNLDPRQAQETMLHLDLDALGLDDGVAYQVFDELSGETFTWQGSQAFIRLEPWTSPAHVLALPSSP